MDLDKEIIKILLDDYGSYKLETLSKLKAMAQNQEENHKTLHIANVSKRPDPYKCKECGMVFITIMCKMQHDRFDRCGH